MARALQRQLAVEEWKINLKIENGAIICITDLAVQYENVTLCINKKSVSGKCLINGNQNWIVTAFYNPSNFNFTFLKRLPPIKAGELPYMIFW